jgi:mannose-1-phosphate guanylyltransferase
MILHPWTIVLAAGAGRRLAPLTGGIPKQYWSPNGTRPLLGRTVARMASVSSPERTLTIVAEGHRRYLRELQEVECLGEVIYQPRDRGTATGVLLPLAAVAARDPNGIVIVTPSDHGVEDDECFREGIQRAVARVKSGQAAIVLFGVVPAVVSLDLGWIVPADQHSFTVAEFRQVASFVEKPPIFEAYQLYLSGAVWNTMVLVARVGALMHLFARHMPVHHDVMAMAYTLDQSAREAFLRKWYSELSAADFSRDILMPAKNLSLYTWPSAMRWSDLGTPERFAEWRAHVA